MLLQDPDTLNFSGCISVRQNDRILIENAYGYADWPNQIPNTTQTKFQTASAGKVFVATGILQMVERGVFALGRSDWNVTSRFFAWQYGP